MTHCAIYNIFFIHYLCLTFRHLCSLAVRWVIFIHFILLLIAIRFVKFLPWPHYGDMEKKRYKWYCYSTHHKQSSKAAYFLWHLDHCPHDKFLYVSLLFFALLQFGRAEDQEQLKAAIENYQDILRTKTNPKNLKKFVEAFLKWVYGSLFWNELLSYVTPVTLQAYKYCWPIQDSETEVSVPCI